MQEVQGFQSTAQVERLLLEHGEKVVDRRRGGGGAEIDQVEIKIKAGMERAGGGAVSHNHTHSVYTCLYSLYRNTPLMCVMWTWRLSDECGYLYIFI